ncbi:MAG TPA: protein-export chaperone SecB [Gammaproteobacteria bacterium]|nr:protein-export chaperone SecB [Gammaproteobacteria bacterium]
MAEDTATTAATADDRQILLQRIYVKDCSFESPRSPAVFASPVTPEITVNMHSDSKTVDTDTYEVVLSVTAEAKHEERNVFLVEVKQAGLFVIKGFDEQDLAMIVATYCPNILFPYLREMVSDLTLKGGMAPLLLQPMNFDALFAQQQQAAANGTTGH